MAIASISTQIFDLNGSVYLPNIITGTSDLDVRTRRLNRTGTLDGGAYINDSGYSHGDRTVKIKTKVTESEYEKLVNIIENHSVLWIILEDGAYTGAMERLSQQSGQAQIQLLISGTA